MNIVQQLNPYFHLIFMSLTILLSLAVVMSRAPIYSAICLIGSLLTTAVLYVVLNAYYIAAVQILIYAGGILVLFIYVLMLLGLRPTLRSSRQMMLRIVIFASLLAAAFWSLLPYLMQTQWRLYFDLPNHFGNVEAFGLALLKHYSYPFEIISVILVAALVGVVYMTRREQ